MAASSSARASERKFWYVITLTFRLFAQAEVETARVLSAFTREEADAIALREFETEIARVKGANYHFGEKGGCKKQIQTDGQCRPEA